MSARPVNLNTLRPRAANGYDWENVRRGVSSGKVTVHFGDVATAAEAFISESPMIVGCVAWVKSRRLVAALAQRPVALVVNKEFGLRVQGHPEREPLLLLRGGVPSDALPIPKPKEPVLEPVRCVGWAAKGKFGALMHHMFLVRLSKTGKPVAVWTGSFNLTAGAERNIENALTITDPAVAQAFLEEFTRVWALSEPLLFASGTPTPGSNAKVAERVPVKRAKRKAAAKKPAAKKPAAAKKTATAKKRAAPKKTTKTKTRRTR